VIPLQDVIPTRRVPIATLTLIALNVVCFVIAAGGVPRGIFPDPFEHAGLAPFAIGLLLLWLFGDNVEARLGRAILIGIYLVGGWILGIGATGAITAVMGSYFVLLPRSRVLTLVPFPPVLVEVPAAFYLGLWTVLHLLQFVVHPRTIWLFGLAFAFGAAVGLVVRRPVRW
jgi:membrane associated rhomboid family serine protease